MTLFESIILGLVQGLAEFLPISGCHLAALQYIFGIDGSNVLTFTVMLHFGTLVAIFVVYWKDIVDLVKELFRNYQRHMHRSGRAGKQKRHEKARIYDNHSISSYSYHRSAFKRLL